jgi:hypothetical protein
VTRRTGCGPSVPASIPERRAAAAGRRLG